MGELIFDIGAFKGEYTDRYLAEGKRVIAVEPQKAHADALRQKYQDQPVIVVEAAVGAKTGTEMLYQTRAPWLASLYPERWKIGRFCDYEWRGAGSVKTVTLDDLIDEYGMPDFIKIDTEGGEPEVFAGLTKAAPELSFEFTRELLDDAERCGKRLLEIGDYEFSISYIREDRAGEYTGLDETMKTLRSNNHPLLWGNIYARLKNGQH